MADLIDQHDKYAVDVPDYTPVIDKQDPSLDPTVVKTPAKVGTAPFVRENSPGTWDSKSELSETNMRTQFVNLGSIPTRD